MINKEKYLFKFIIAIIIFIILIGLVGGYFLLIKYKKEMIDKKNQSQELIKKNDMSGFGESPIYVVCHDDYSDFFVYNIKTKEKILILTDKNKDYIVNCFYSESSFSLEDDILSFNARSRVDRLSEFNIKFNIFSKKTTINSFGDNQDNINIVTIGEFYEVPTWSIKKSPDGQNILFLDKGDGYGNLYSADSGYKNITNLENFKELNCLGNWDWLPDSKKVILYDGAKGCNGNGDFIVDFNGDNIKKIDATIGYIPKQGISIDNNYVAVIHDYNDNKNKIATINIDSAKLVKILALGFYVKISNDNKNILYSDNSRNIFIMNISGEEIKEIGDNGIPIGWISITD